MGYSREELEDARAAMRTWVHKIGKARETMMAKERPPKPQITLATRNLKALGIAMALIERELGDEG